MKAELNSCAYDRSKELKNCSFIKTVMMLSVVVFHSSLFWLRDSFFVEKAAFPAPPLALLAEFLGAIHIYVFTLISGYIFSYQKLEVKKYTFFASFVLNKTKRLIVPYAFVSMFWVIPFAILFFKYDALTIFNRYFLATNPNQLWFLLMLFEVYLIGFLLCNCFADKGLLGFLFVFIIYIAGLIGRQFIPNYFGIWKTCEFLLFFYIGFKIRQYGSMYLRKNITVLLFLTFVFFLLFHFFSKQTQFAMRLMGRGFESALNVIGSCTAFILCQKTADIKNWERNMCFSFVSQKAMGIYLFHQQFVYISFYLFNGYLNPYLNFFLNVIISLSASICMTSLFMKFRITRFLIGEK